MFSIILGPSFTVDSACSSSFVALWSAYHDVVEGRVDAALVNAGQLCLSPVMTTFYVDGGIVSATCQSSPFDEKGKGKEFFSLTVKSLILREKYYYKFITFAHLYIIKYHRLHVINHYVSL